MKTKYRQLTRLLRINIVLMRHGLDEIVLATHLFRPVSFISYCNPFNWFRNRHIPRAQRIKEALEDLGPIYVKFGQILSTRQDILPDDIAKSLSELQDKVKPFEGQMAKAIIEQSFKKTIADLFKEFELTPLASGSVAQVHGAILHSGESVVVKVLRPGIASVIAQDIALLYTLADLANRYWPDAARLRLHEVVAEIEHTLENELDLLREAANASQLRRNFSNSPILYIPQLHWDYCHTNAIVMERIYGIPITQIEQLRAAGINLPLLAERGVEIFFTQVFRDCFFHADMHAGNIFVERINPENPRYIAVDFGIVGTLSPQDQNYLAQNLLAFFNRDYLRVAQLHVESGWVPASTRVDLFESAIRTVCEPIFERPLKDISFGAMLLRLFQTARSFEMEVQPQLVLLQKTLLSIEGLGRQLHPDLNLWTTAKPYLEKWMREQVGYKAIVKAFKRRAPYWSAALPELPERILRNLEQSERLLEVQNKQQLLLEKLIAQNTQSERKMGIFMVISVLIIAAMGVVSVGIIQGYAFL